MRIKQLAISTIAAGLIMWIVSGIWHNIILTNFYKEETGAEHDGIFVLLLAYFVLAFLMSYIYSRLNKGSNYWFEGVKFGMIMGLLWVFPHELAMAGAHGDPLDYVFKNAIWHMVEQAFGGIVIALIYRKK